MSEERYVVAVDESPGGKKPKRSGRWYVMSIYGGKRPIDATTVDFVEDMMLARQYCKSFAEEIAQRVNGYVLEIVAAGGRV